MPYRFQPISAATDPMQQLAIINRNFAELDNEAVTKVFNDGGVPGLITGKLPNGRFGTLDYDNGIARELKGFSPVTGRWGHWISKSGVDVIDLLTAAGV